MVERADAADNDADERIAVIDDYGTAIVVPGILQTSSVAGGDRLEAVGIVVADVVYTGAHGNSHERSIIGLEQVLDCGKFGHGVEPSLECIGFKDHRHAIMDRPDRGIGLADDDGATLDGISSLWA